jgi:hypothetical protein
MFVGFKKIPPKMTPFYKQKADADHNKMVREFIPKILEKVNKAMSFKRFFWYSFRSLTTSLYRLNRRDHRRNTHKNSRAFHQKMGLDWHRNG